MINNTRRMISQKAKSVHSSISIYMCVFPLYEKFEALEYLEMAYKDLHESQIGQNTNN